MNAHKVIPIGERTEKAIISSTELKVLEDLLKNESVDKNVIQLYRNINWTENNKRKRITPAAKSHSGSKKGITTAANVKTMKFQNLTEPEQERAIMPSKMADSRSGFKPITKRSYSA